MTVNDRWPLSGCGVLQTNYPGGPSCAWLHVKVVDDGQKNGICFLRGLSDRCYGIFVITSIFALVTVCTYDRVISATYCMWLRLRLVLKPVVFDVTSCVCISVDVNATFRVVPVLELLDLRTLPLDARWSEVRLLCNATRMYTVVVSVCWLAYSCAFVCVWVCGVWICQCVGVCCVCVELERSFCSKL